MKNKTEFIKRLRDLKEVLKKRYKVKEIGIFGSIIRDEQKESSDIDILVDFEDNADLFDFVGLSLFLEEALHKKVDLVSRRALREEIKGAILKEVASV